MNRVKKVLCFALAGLFLFATPMAHEESNKTYVKQNEEYDDEFLDFIEWEIEDNYERDLRNGVIV